MCLGALCLIVALPTRGSDWPQWRGPAGDGVVTGKTLPTNWSEEQNIVWKAAIPGTGWSQPVVTGDKVFVTTAITQDQAKPKAGDFNPLATADGQTLSIPSLLGGGSARGSAPQPPTKTYEWKVLCLDAPSGRILWEQTARYGAPLTTVNRNNTYASETPVTDGERLIAYFGNHGVYCYDLSGKLLWSADLGAHPIQFGWGTGSSPVLHGDRVFIQCDNEEASFLVALDKATGQPVWRVARDERSNWSTPYLFKGGQRAELITAGGTKVRSYDPANGDLLWAMSANGRNSLTPVGNEGLLVVDSVDRLTGRTGMIVAIRPGATGDPSATSDSESGQVIAWRLPLRTTRVASPLLYQGCLYLLDQQAGRVRCHNAETGAEHYAEQLPGVRGFTASPWANEGKVFCLDERGTTLVLEAGPTCHILATNKLDDTFWSSMAVVDADLLLRGVDHLYRLGKGSTKRSTN